MKIKLKNIATFLDRNSVYYDVNFQRRECWGNEALSDFIASATKGWLQHTCLTFASVKHCLEYSKTVGDDYSIKYFQKLRDEGYEYVSIDGQNRAKKAIAFISGEVDKDGKQVTISGTRFLDADDNLVSVENKLFAHLPPRLKDRVGDSEILVTVYRNLTRENLAEMFELTNKQPTPNAQALRQSKTTPIANWVRRVSKNCNSAMKKVIPSNKFKLMDDDELIAKTAMCLIYKYDDEWFTKASSPAGLGLTKRDLDMWYQLGQGIYDLDESKYNVEALNRAERIIEQVSMVLTRQDKYPDNKLVKMDKYWSLVYVCEWLLDNDYVISDLKSFFRELCDFEERLQEQGMRKWLTAKKEELKKGRDPSETLKESNYYHRQVSLNQQVNKRKPRKDEIIKALQSKQISLFSVKKSDLGQDVA